MATHPLHALGFEPLTASLDSLGFEPQRMVRPQPVGTREPDSGRKIVQLTDNPAINQALATDAMPAYKARLLEAIRHIPGARLARSRDAKNPHRLLEKIERQGQPAETVSDYGAAQIAVDSPQAKAAVVAAVKQHFTVLRQQDNFALGDPEYHYRSYSLQVQMPNGASEELQIVPDEVFQANRAEHHDYKQVRNAELAGRSAEPAKAAARALNDSAMDRFNSRNGVPARILKGRVQKGSRVRLADGAVARVVYVDPNMRIARVRTEDGRNITVRHKDLRGSS
jgi:Region found in RelA / SpoT proteins